MRFREITTEITSPTKENQSGITTTIQRITNSNHCNSVNIEYNGQSLINVIYGIDVNARPYCEIVYKSGYKRKIGLDY